MRFFYDALGCPKALVDAEKMVRHLRDEDYEMTHDPSEADIIVINTCGFIESAKQESINAILDYTELKKQKPELKIIVSGCLSERYKGELKELIPEIDNMLGVRNPSLITRTVKESYQGHLADAGDYSDLGSKDDRDLVFSGMNTAYLKISEGCDRSCSFCAIPGIRGTLRSRSIDTIVTEAKGLIEQGIKEIILIGEDLCAYGNDLSEEINLIGLLEELLKLDIPWLRLLYLFPGPLLPRIAELMQKHPNLCPYIDIPLQHASPRILQSMARPGNAQIYLKMLEEMRKLVPHLAVRTAFIIGFPGETDEDISILEDFLKSARLDRVGFFAYSDEEETPAYNLPQKVDEDVKQERISRLALIQQQISRELLNRKKGLELDCINDGIMIEEDGVIYHQLRSIYDAPEIDGRVLIPGDSFAMEDHDLVKIRVTDLFSHHDLIGETIE